VDRQENIYVTDEWLNQVSVFDQDGKFLKKWSTLEKDDGQEHGTSGIAMDADKNIYVTDGRSHEVRKFTKDGIFLTKWGSYGTDNGQFNAPWGITIDTEGYVYVADHQNHRVQKFTSDGKWGALFGQPGTGRGGLYLPVGVAVDPDGDVYVCDWSDNGVNPGRVHIFDKEGKFIITLIGDAQQLSKWAQMTVDANADYLKRRREVPTTEPEWRFAVPTGVAFDAARDRFIVVDNQRSRLQIYNKVKEYLVPQMNL
jgi:DNA-binding beta-propeller fold protein YncE